MPRFEHCRIRAALAAIIAAAFAPLGAAQAEPGVIRGPAVNKAFPAPPANLDIYTDQLTGDKSGVFTCCLTTQAGPSVPPEVVIGRYDQTRGMFTPTKEAAALNTAIGADVLSLEPRLGRYAVLSQGWPRVRMFAARSRAGIPFPKPPVKIGRVPAGTVQTALGYVGGKLKLC